MENWEKVYHITPCYFFSFSNAGLIVKINNVLLDHLGYAADEVLHVKKLTELLTVGSKIFFDTHFYPLIKMRGMANEIFLSFKTKEGNELPVLLNVLLERDGDQYEIYCGGMQISNRNRFEKELLEAKKVAEAALLENKELNEVKLQLKEHQEILEQQLQELSRINSEQQQINKVLAHDLQEPIRKISMFSKRLVNDFSDSIHPTTVSYLKRISVSSDRIRNLIDSMERFLSLHHRELRIERINLAKVFDKAKERSDLNGRSDVCVTLISDLEVNADEELLVQIFIEILNNSVKFRKKNGEMLQISLLCEHIMQNIFRELDDKYKYTRFVRITYTDNGEGFNNEYASKLFHLFYKDNPTGEGLGLGLAKCQKIVGLHQGSISASGRVGIGATFTILLPAVELV